MSKTQKKKVPDKLQVYIIDKDPHNRQNCIGKAYLSMYDSGNVYVGYTANNTNNTEYVPERYKNLDEI